MLVPTRLKFEPSPGSRIGAHALGRIANAAPGAAVCQRSGTRGRNIRDLPAAWRQRRNDRLGQGPLCTGQRRAGYFDRLDRSRVHGLEEKYSAAPAFTGFTGSGSLCAVRTMVGMRTPSLPGFIILTRGHPGHLKVLGADNPGVPAPEFQKIGHLWHRSPRPSSFRLQQPGHALRMEGSSSRIATCITCALPFISSLSDTLTMPYHKVGGAENVLLELKRLSTASLARRLDVATAGVRVRSARKNYRPD